LNDGHGHGHSQGKFIQTYSQKQRSQTPSYPRFFLIRGSMFCLAGVWLV